MPRTALTVLASDGPYDADGISVTWTAADVTNKNQFTPTGREVVLARNTDGVTAYSVTITSVADDFGRTRDMTVSIPANGFRMFEITALAGWQQSDGQIYLEATNTAIQFAVIRLKR